jgi:hypothetical protein
VAWLVKEWQPGAPLVVFGIIAVAAAVAGLFRGHLLFVQRMNARGFHVERRRAEKVTLIVDLLIAVALIADALLIFVSRNIPAVLIGALGVVLAGVRLVIEPSTSDETFPDSSPETKSA